MKRIAAVWTSLIMGAALLSGCQSGLLRKATGSVAVEREQVAGQMPTRSPSIIYVTDFALDAEHFQEDQGVRGLLPGRLRERASSRLGAAIPGPLAGTDPVVQARQIVNALTDALVKSLSEKGMPAKALNPAAETMPPGGWMVSGVFTEVDEGNRIKRATIGFGRGATHM
ncbi:MAG: putative lipoprotein, partial [Proteobacteria bacterium]|nr:putative lipoprotein [Pseudomonadota bacterium]